MASSTPPGTALARKTPGQIREWFKRAVKGLGLHGRGLLLYSLRRGGITASFVAGTSITNLAQRARWMDHRTARVYITEGRKLVMEATLTPAQQSTLQQFAVLLQPAA